MTLITNEGNGRFCTSVPRVLVSITGMEKVVPSMEDLAIFLRLLPRAATGQRISSYVTHVYGPKRPGDEDGPEEYHLVIVDNGRSRLLADPDLRESLYCIRCGACLNTCPVYRKVGGHSYGWVYPGPIGAVVSPVLVGLERSKDLPNASSLCGACRGRLPDQDKHSAHAVEAAVEPFGGFGVERAEGFHCGQGAGRGIPPADD